MAFNRLADLPIPAAVVAFPNSGGERQSIIMTRLCSLMEERAHPDENKRKSTELGASTLEERARILNCPRALAPSVMQDRLDHAVRYDEWERNNVFASAHARAELHRGSRGKTQEKKTSRPHQPMHGPSCVEDRMKRAP
jgi:hypothetical protein